MVAVRLARGWIGYDGTVHEAGELVDVDPVTLAKMEAAGVVTPSEGYVPDPTDAEEPTVPFAGPTVADEPDEAGWAGPTASGERGWAGPTVSTEPDGDDEVDSDGPTGASRT